MRTESQFYWDANAILLMMDCVNKKWTIDGNLKIQKLMFVSELKGFAPRLKIAHYRFFRFTHGPYAKDLANDVIRLKELGFITNNTNQLTKRGNFLNEFLSTFINQSDDARNSAQVFENVCAEYGKFSGLQLRDRVYQMVVPVIDMNNEKQKVADIQTYTDIVDPLRDDNLKDVNPFPDEVLSYLKTEFSMSAAEVDPDNPAVQKASLSFLESLVQ